MKRTDIIATVRVLIALFCAILFFISRSPEPTFRHLRTI